ncbi:MAG: acyl-CoA dehydrogenase N-terminal domain-containing protein, partial [Spirosomataceae bacterium]
MFYSKRDLKFNLYELLNVGELNKYSYYEDHSSETFDLVLESAGQIAEKM